MIKIFPTDKVKELDQYTIQNEPISSIDLVERASTVFVHEFCRRYSCLLYTSDAADEL